MRKKYKHARAVTCTSLNKTSPTKKNLISIQRNVNTEYVTLLKTTQNTWRYAVTAIIKTLPMPVFDNIFTEKLDTDRKNGFLKDGVFKIQPIQQLAVW